jgi:hypothetical protein
MRTCERTAQGIADLHGAPAPGDAGEGGGAANGGDQPRPHRGEGHRQAGGARAGALHRGPPCPHRKRHIGRWRGRGTSATRPRHWPSSVLLLPQLPRRSAEHVGEGGRKEIQEQGRGRPPVRRPWGAPSPHLPLHLERPREGERKEGGRVFFSGWGGRARADICGPFVSGDVACCWPRKWISGDVVQSNYFGRRGPARRAGSSRRL